VVLVFVVVVIVMSGYEEVVYLEYVPIPNINEFRRCVEEKEQQLYYIENPNDRNDNAMWSCKRYWLSPIWKAWKGILMKLGISWQLFEQAAAFTDPLKLLTADENKLKYAWIEFLKALVNGLNTVTKELHRGKKLELRLPETLAISTFLKNLLS
jgi:hypothetical protein